MRVASIARTRVATGGAASVGRGCWRRPRARVDARTDDATRAMKAAARDRAREALRRMTREDMHAADASIEGRLGGMRRARDARRVAAYLASERLRECATSGFVRQALASGNKRVFVPLVSDASTSSMRMLEIEDPETDVERGAYGLPEPRATRADGSRRVDALEDIETVGALDVIIVPGFAFGEDGRRLGRGGGYYDAFLARYADACVRVNASPPLVVALAYECQICPPGVVPIDAHDRIVDVVVTESRSFACTSAGSDALA